MLLLTKSNSEWICGLVVFVIYAWSKVRVVPVCQIRRVLVVEMQVILHQKSGCRLNAPLCQCATMSARTRLLEFLSGKNNKTKLKNITEFLMHICKSTVVTTQNTVEKCINNFLTYFLSDIEIKSMYQTFLMAFSDN